MLKAAAIAAAVLVGAGALTAGQASADDLVLVDTGRDGSAGADVVLHPQEPGAPGGSASGSEPTWTDATSTCTYLGQGIDCTSANGVWSQDRQCFVRKLDVEVSDRTPFQGHTDGAVYRCSTPGSTGGGLLGVGPGSSYLFWGPEGGNGAPNLVDPVTLAREAIERMQLAAPRVGMTPLGDAPLLVGVDAWLWLDNNDARGYGPTSRTATAGSTSVTARAKVTKVVWDMGDGARVTCRNPGTPWTAARGTGPSPTCGYRYEKPSTSEPDESYTVRATAHWQVDWNGAGQAGQITFRLTGTRQVEVTELQVLQSG